MRALSTFGIILISSALAGCQMVDSNWLDTNPELAGTTCHSNAGTYHLPRRLITATVTGSDANGFALNVQATGDPAPYVADRNETYCLDFLFSPTSADRVGVQRGADGLLQRIFTQADDKSKKIAIDLIQATADLAASERATRARSVRPMFSENADPTLAVFQFDPFVEREAREVNYALAEFGYCLYLEHRNDPFVPRWSEKICLEIAGIKAKRRQRGGPKYHGPSMVYKADAAYPRSGLPIFDPNPVPKHLQARGILYRPELSHSLVVVRQPDPGSRFSEWRAVGSERIVVPNAAPAFILQIERAYFVRAETDVQFTFGLIRNISVNKPSELLAAADIAVAAAQIVTNIPATALNIFNNRADNTIELMQTNAQLIELLRQRQADADAKALANAAAPPAGAAQSETDSGPFQRSAGPRSTGRAISTDLNPESSALSQCLRDPATQRYPDPLRACLEIIKRSP